MRKLHLIAMSYDKDAILNAMQRTGAVEVVLHTDTENTAVPAFCVEENKEYLSSVESALCALCSKVDEYEKERKIKSDVTKDGFDVTYDEFITATSQKERCEKAVQDVSALLDARRRLQSELSTIRKAQKEASAYAGLTEPFVRWKDTAKVSVRLGLVSPQNVEKLEGALKDNELVVLETLSSTNEYVIVAIYAHKSVLEETETALVSVGFVRQPYGDVEKSGRDIYQETVQEEKRIIGLLEKNEEDMYALRTEIRPLKVYAEYLTFALEKEEVSEKLRVTKRTFLLEAYVPKFEEERVQAVIRETAKASYVAFSDPTEEENPPTLLRNNTVVGAFEGITNMYSPPHYREFDPNAVMGFFYSIFMGFIIGDAGYGLLMALVGGWIWWKNRKRPTGFSRLAGSFGFGGIFAIVWGLLFNSLFGFAILPKTVMPNPQEDMWSLVGIAVPSVLIISMFIGLFQIFVGYVCKAIQEWRRGNVADALCDGAVWAVFTVGVALAILGFVSEANLPKLALVGGIMAGGALVLAMLTAGRKEKFFGKFTKGFGAAYGVINFASDILSYARLYGLMLSGAVIASIVSQYGGGFVASGNPIIIVLGVLLLVVGHGFNLVMNLLGAYIHDARLQYVEFYGRFYEGDGTLFAPLGSKRKYVYLLPAENNKTL
ncbi:MAG: V-type ATP synthase subunit I [Clostridia bacterium]|nr:V-type ATP synthase subunit I [Clostridia bacterium]